ncbi:MAG: hypothetical protein M1514_02265 [Patescibacteria group bacterium]|nr:hypothetical protein [Patescibacteria group bacterium]
MVVMMAFGQSELLLHFLTTLIYFLLLTLGRGKFDLSLVSLWLGAILGMFLLDLDRIIDAFWVHPEEAKIREIREIWERRGIWGVRGIWGKLQKDQQRHLIFHTVTFQVILLVLAFYILTAGGSLLGSALVMAINLHLLVDEWKNFLQIKKEVVTDWLFWQVKGLLMERYLPFYLGGVSLIFVIFSFLLRTN